MKIQRRYTISGAVILLVILLLPLINATAQSGGPLNYGSSVTGAITAETPLALYTFNGTQGDLVSINVYGQPGGLLPTFDLVGPAQQALASSQPDTFAANLQAPIGGETSLAILLPTTGAYSLLVAGNNGTLGDFILQLQGRSPVNAVPLTLDQAITATVQTNAPPQWYSFSAGECPTMLTAFNPSTGTPYTFPYIVKVRDEHGTTLANWRGGESVEDQVTVQPLTGPYEVEVWADDATQSGSIALLITCADAAEECPPTESSTAPDTAAASEAICPTCEPCPGDEPERDICSEFRLQIQRFDDGRISVSWPPVEGANAAIVSYINEAGELVYAHMVNDILEDTVDLAMLGEPGIYTVRVTVGSEALGYTLCAETGTFTMEGEGPVHWGPAAGDDDEADECTVEIIAPRDIIANGLQTIFWSEVPGAESYRLRIYGQFDIAVADGAISAPATSMTMDVSEASIGVGYGGEPDFYIQINAYRDGESWCANGVRVTRNP